MKIEPNLDSVRLNELGESRRAGWDRTITINIYDIKFNSAKIS